jgi:hypothetical protein
MTPYQEPKYKIENGKIVNRQSGDIIPDDEPIIIFRARDLFSEYALSGYLKYIEGEHYKAVKTRYIQFRNWQEAHPERVKKPDTQVDGGWTEKGTP